MRFWLTDYEACQTSHCGNARLVAKQSEVDKEIYTLEASDIREDGAMSRQFAHLELSKQEVKQLHAALDHLLRT